MLALKNIPYKVRDFISYCFLCQASLKNCNSYFRNVIWKKTTQKVCFSFQVLNGASEKNLDDFIEKSAENDFSLPTEINSKKLVKVDLYCSNNYKTYKEKHCFKNKMLLGQILILM